MNVHGWSRAWPALLLFLAGMALGELGRWSLLAGLVVALVVGASVGAVCMRWSWDEFPWMFAWWVYRGRCPECRRAIRWQALAYDATRGYRCVRCVGQDERFGGDVLWSPGTPRPAKPLSWWQEW